MDLFLFHHSEFQRQYNCTKVNIDDVPLSARRHVIEGWIAIILCALYYTLYIPCIISLYKHINVPCYRLLFYMSVCDCSVLWVPGFFHGYMAIEGAVFCSHPTVIFITGAATLALWMMESSAELILSINRCVAVLSPKTEQAIFGGWRVNVWITASVFYGFLWLFFSHPVLFNGIYFSWVFNPYAGYNDAVAEEYNTVLHIIWDGLVMAIGVPFGYLTFFVVLLLKRRKYNVTATNKVASSEKMMFIQTTIISLLNFFTGSIYSYMMYFETNELLVHIAHWSWYHIHGLPPVVFLLLNKTIRNDTKRMIHRCLGLKVNGVWNVFSLSSKVANDQNCVDMASELH